ncbi:MAG: carbohydrate ABC transporter permease [Clostridia bacterium]|nr:carbohydrate ABC transporter permease [Clostridia bacterium]
MLGSVSETRRPAWGAWLLLAAVTLPLAAFYAWLLLASWSDGMEGFRPLALTARNWSFLWSADPMAPSVWKLTLNTFLFAALVALGEIGLASTAAYALSRLHVPGRRLWLSMLIILHAFPGITLLVAMFVLLQRLGLYDTLLGVVLAKIALDLPFHAWVLKGFYDQVSWDHEMAGLLDGANRLTVWRRVVLPIIRPGLVASGVFAFLSGWSEFLLPYVLAPGAETQTLSVYLGSLLSQADMADYGTVAAVAVFYMAPVLLVYFFLQRFLVELYSGGVKR